MRVPACTLTLLAGVLASWRPGCPGCLCVSLRKGRQRSCSRSHAVRVGSTPAAPPTLPPALQGSGGTGSAFLGDQEGEERTSGQLPGPRASSSRHSFSCLRQLSSVPWLLLSPFSGQDTCCLLACLSPHSAGRPKPCGQWRSRELLELLKSV